MFGMMLVEWECLHEKNEHQFIARCVSAGVDLSSPAPSTSPRMRRHFDISIDLLLRLRRVLRSSTHIATVLNFVFILVEAGIVSIQNLFPGLISLRS